MALLLGCRTVGLPAACWCQLGLHWHWRELGLEKYCGLKFVILPSHLLFFYPLVRSCSGTVGQDTADQVKDLSGKGECPCWGRQQEVPWAIKDRCGKSTGSAERGGVHTINLNFSRFPKLVSTEAIPDFFPVFPTPSPLLPPPNPVILFCSWREPGNCAFFIIFTTLCLFKMHFSRQVLYCTALTEILLGCWEIVVYE